MLQEESDLLTVAGSSTSISVLKNAGISSCDLLISVLHDENINIITCILGKKLGAKRTIARVSSIEYLTDDNKSMLRGLGIDEIVSPERINLTGEQIWMSELMIYEISWNLSNSLCQMVLHLQ